MGPVDEPEGDLPYGFPSLGLRASAGHSRLRMTSGDGTRMIQIQNGWFVVNWTRRSDEYPGYENVRNLFDQMFAKFERFVKAKTGRGVRPNLWEVTYIDHIEHGSVWKSLSDLPRVFPGLFGSSRFPGGEIEAVDSTWTWKLSSIPGRLRVSVQLARDSAESEKSILLVRSTARGSLDAPGALALGQALDDGRASVVGAFKTMASKEALDYWRGTT